MGEEYEWRNGGRYGKGREWLREWDREREELRRKYDGWELEWERWYGEWRRERGADLSE